MEASTLHADNVTAQRNDRALSIMTKIVRKLHRTSRDDETASLLRENFYYLSENMIQNLNRMFTETVNNERLFSAGMIFAKMLVNNVSPMMIDNVAYYIENASHQHLEDQVFERFRWDSEVAVQYHPLSTDITGMGYYSKLTGYLFRPGTSLRDQSENARKQTTALFRLHEYAHRIADHQARDKRIVEVTANNTIEPYQIAQIAIDRPERVDDLIAIIDQRQTVDADLIIEILDAEVPVLAEGML